MIHVGQNFSPMRAILPLLKRGDIVTHMYAPPPNSILDEQGRLFPDVAAARRRGIIFDFGNGVAGHFNWDMVESATKQGFWPDTLSTDWNTMSKTTGVVDFPNVMSKFLMFGMPLDQVIACATVNAARVFPAFDDRGTLNVGAPADVAIMELREGDVRIPRQLQRHAHRQAAAVPDRDRARRQADTRRGRRTGGQSHPTPARRADDRCADTLDPRHHR